LKKVKTDLKKRVTGIGKTEVTKVRAKLNENHWHSRCKHLLHYHGGAIEATKSTFYSSCMVGL